MVEGAEGVVQTGEEIAKIVAVAVIQAALRCVLVIVQLQMVVALGFQSLFNQCFELTA